MAEWPSDQFAITLGNPALGGLTGSPDKVRAASWGGRTRKRIFTFTNLASGGWAANDTFLLAKLVPTDIIYGVRVYTPGGGAGVTFDVGFRDNNTTPPTVTATKFMAAGSLAAAAAIDAALNLPSQAGVDPQGDQSPGNKPLGFGSLKNDIIGTIHGSPTAGTGNKISGWVEYQED